MFSNHRAHTSLCRIHRARRFPASSRSNHVPGKFRSCLLFSTSRLFCLLVDQGEQREAEAGREREREREKERERRCINALRRSVVISLLTVFSRARDNNFGNKTNIYSWHARDAINSVIETQDGITGNYQNAPLKYSPSEGFAFKKYMAALMTCWSFSHGGMRKIALKLTNTTRNCACMEPELIKVTRKAGSRLKDAHLARDFFGGIHHVP